MGLPNIPNTKITILKCVYFKEEKTNLNIWLYNRFNDLKKQNVCLINFYV